MDLKEFISSGIIESYVLGTASENEQQEVQQMAKLHGEVAEAISDYEKTLEEFSFLNAVKPPDSVRDKFMAEIEEIQEKDEDLSASDTLPIYPKNKAKQRIWKMTAVAATILFLISVGTNLMMFSKNKSYKDKTAEIAKNQATLKKQNQTLKTEQEKTNQQFAVLLNPSVKQVVLKGVNSHPENMVATVYWNKQDNAVYLGKLNLPAPPSGKAYQLWAIVDKKPVDMGMYNPEKDGSLKSMKNLKSGEISAFAITLEKKGGSAQPTMNQMYVMGPAT